MLYLNKEDIHLDNTTWIIIHKGIDLISSLSVEPDHFERTIGGKYDQYHQDKYYTESCNTK